MENMQIKKKTYNELEFLINCLDDDLKSKIPNSYLEQIQQKKIAGYFPKIDINLPLEEQNFSKEAYAMFGMVYLQYICTDNENRKNFIRELNKKKGS